MKNIWLQINNEYHDESTNRVLIDAWETEDDNEQGKVIAEIDQTTGEVFYNDDRAKTDELAQEKIIEIVNDIYTINRLKRYGKNN